MDEVCMFGRSVDVDGDEWIDLGVPSATCGDNDGTVFGSIQASVRDDNKVGELRTLKTDKGLESAALEPMSEPEVTQEGQLTKVKQPNKVPRQQPVKVKRVETSQSGKLSRPSSATAMKAMQSKEALVAFYLGRAKQMEVKSKKILVSSAPPVVIRSLQEPFGS